MNRNLYISRWPTPNQAATLHNPLSFCLIKYCSAASINFWSNGGVELFPTFYGSMPTLSTTSGVTINNYCQATILDTKACKYPMFTENCLQLAFRYHRSIDRPQSKIAQSLYGWHSPRWHRDKYPCQFPAALTQ